MCPSAMLRLQGALTCDWLSGSARRSSRVTVKVEYRSHQAVKASCAAGLAQQGAAQGFLTCATAVVQFSGLLVSNLRFAYGQIQR